MLLIFMYTSFLPSKQLVSNIANAPNNIPLIFPPTKSYDQPRQHIKKHRCYFTNKVPSSQSYGFSSGHVWMWELDYEESAEELMLLNCGIGEDSWESLGLQGDPTSQS